MSSGIVSTIPISANVAYVLREADISHNLLFIDKVNSISGQAWRFTEQRRGGEIWC